MFLQLSISSPDPFFSWILVKNPFSSYTKNLGCKDDARIVEGTWRIPNQEYQIVIRNDYRFFLRWARENNAESYLSKEMYLVCPSNLIGVYETFRSAISGKNDSKGAISDEEFFRPRMLQVKVGPIANHGKFDWFSEWGIRAWREEAGTETCAVWIFETISPMSVTEFLQKIYLLLMAVTMKDSRMSRLEEGQVNQFVRLSSGWLNPKSSEGSKLIQRLSKGLKSFEKKFESIAVVAENNEILDGDDEFSQVKEDLEVKLSLHEQRHKLLLESIKRDAKNILDLGSGEGRILRNALELCPEARITTVEVVLRKHLRLRDSLRSERVKFIWGNLLFPKNPFVYLYPDVLILSEVIEHLEKKDRERLVRMIVEWIKPSQILFSTPNKAYNSILGLKEFRHKDHRIEYLEEDLNQEVIEPLSRTGYAAKKLKMIEENEWDMQPSFCVVFEKKNR